MNADKENSFCISLVTTSSDSTRILVLVIFLIPVLMASNYNLYLSSYKLKTTKLSYCGYTYYLSKTYKGTKYYKCDQREICQAGLINKDGAWKPGRN